MTWYLFLQISAKTQSTWHLPYKQQLRKCFKVARRFENTEVFKKVEILQMELILQVA